jgi:predicted AAA+ superfamily ATPase
MKRKIYSELLDWKAKGARKPLILMGARQVGKTYIIEEFLSREFSKHLTFNLFDRSDICAIFLEDIQTSEKIRRLELLHGEKIDFENTAIFFDEVQHSEDIIASLKYFTNSKINYKIICAGSLLGVKINRFSKSFPVGKVEMLYMHPMDFEEYLWANGEHELSEEIRCCYKKNKNMSEPLHEKCLHRYRLYLCAGGMPEAVTDLILKENDVLRFNGKILSDIRLAYLADMTKYIISKAESAKIEAVYNSIPSQLGNKSGKFQYSEVQKGVRSRDFSSALQWLVSSGMILRCDAVSAPNLPLRGYVRDGIFKMFLNDNGLLCNLLSIRLSEIMLDSDFYYKDIITENYAASQLVAAGIPLFYWQGENTHDIDFLIDTEQGIIPVEVKSGKNKASASLESYRKNYNCAYALKIRKGNFGFTNKIRNIPLYAVFCLKNTL